MVQLHLLFMNLFILWLCPAITMFLFPVVQNWGHFKKGSLNTQHSSPYSKLSFYHYFIINKLARGQHHIFQFQHKRHFSGLGEISICCCEDLNLDRPIFLVFQCQEDLPKQILKKGQKAAIIFADGREIHWLWWWSRNCTIQKENWAEIFKAENPEKGWSTTDVRVSFH